MPVEALHQSEREIVDAGAMNREQARASALLRGVVQAHAASLLPYGVSVSMCLILAAFVPPISYTIFLLWYAFLLLVVLIATAPFFAWPLRHIPIGSTYSTLRAL